MFGLTAIFLSGLLGRQGLLAAPDQILSPSHRQIRLIRPQVDGSKVHLHTIASDASGDLIVAASPHGEVSKAFGQPRTGYVLKLDTAGEVVHRWQLDFIPTALAVADDAVIFVGGGGYIAQLHPQDGLVAKIDSPHIGDRETFAKRTLTAQKSFLAGSQVVETSLEPFRNRIAELEEIAEEDRSRIESAELSALKRQVDMIESLVSPKEESSEGSDDAIDLTNNPATYYTVQRAKEVTSVAVSDDWLFVCAMDPTLREYSIWKLPRDWKDAQATNVQPTKILDGLRGCCGQMDIQCGDNELIISQNGSFNVGFYDFEGQPIRTFGQQDRTSQDGFGSCCNPMNTMSLADGSVVTAESSIGHLKRFDRQGNFISYIGKASIGGGCKHCAIGHNADADLYFMMYQDENAICVLGRIEEYPPTEADLLAAKRSLEFAQRFAGTWRMVPADKATGGKREPGQADTMADVDQVLVVVVGSGFLPFTDWTIFEDGTVTLNEGKYAGFVETGTLQSLPPEDGDAAESYHIGVAEDQVRMFDAKIVVDGDEMLVRFFGGDRETRFHRVDAAPGDQAASCEESCSKEACDKPSCEGSKCEGSKCEGSKCEEGSCERSSCNDAAAAKDTRPGSPDQAALLAVMESIDTATRDQDVATFSVDSMPTSKMQYKLLSIKGLGEDRQKTLNDLGADGWDYCGNLGAELMFKRAAGVVVKESK